MILLTVRVTLNENDGKDTVSFACQVASQETYGTLGAIVKSQTGSRQVGFLTNRHVAVDLDYPNQKMFHPLPPSLGPGVYLGAVERATSFITDELWYGIFAGINPGNEDLIVGYVAYIAFGARLYLSDHFVNGTNSIVKNKETEGRAVHIHLSHLC